MLQAATTSVLRLFLFITWNFSHLKSQSMQEIYGEIFWLHLFPTVTKAHPLQPKLRRVRCTVPWDLLSQDPRSKEWSTQWYQVSPWGVDVRGYSKVISATAQRAFYAVVGETQRFFKWEGRNGCDFFFIEMVDLQLETICANVYIHVYIYIQQKDSHPKKSWQFLFRRFLNDIWWWIWNLDHKQCVWRFVDRHDWQSTRGVSWDVTLHFTQDPWSMDCRGLPRGRESTFFLHGWDNRNIDCRI